MVDPASCLVLVASASGSSLLLDVAKTTLGGVWEGIADRTYCQLTKVISDNLLTSGKLPANHDLVKGLDRAFTKSLDFALDTIDAHVSNSKERAMFIAMRKFVDSKKPLESQNFVSLPQVIATLVADGQTLSVRDAQAVLIDTAVGDLIRWFEDGIGEPLTQSFCELLTKPSPNRNQIRPPWHVVLKLQLDELIKSDERFRSIFLAANVSETLGVAISIEQLLMSTNLTLSQVDHKVSSLGGDVSKVKELLQALQVPELKAALKQARIDIAAPTNLARIVNDKFSHQSEAIAVLQSQIASLLDVARQSSHRSNLGDFIDTALDEVASLSLSGDFSQAMEKADQSFQIWEQRELERYDLAQVQAEKLITANIRQCQFMLDARQAAVWVEKLVRYKSKSREFDFDSLYREINVWLDRGRDKHLSIELQIAAEAAHILEMQSSSQTELSRAQNLRGIALWRLGEIEIGPVTLLAAVDVFDSAIANRPRQEFPLDWAKSQISKGGVWFRLGHRDSITGALVEAERCFELALEECNIENAPFEWAAAHNNLGNALFVRGEQTLNAELIRSAIHHFKQSLRVRTKVKFEASWSMTKMNIGCAYTALGEFEEPQKNHAFGVRSLEQSISVRSRKDAPYHWAKAANNLGVALCKLGVAKQCLQTLQRSLEIQKEALSERPKDQVPLEWCNSATEVIWVKFRIYQMGFDFVDREQSKLTLIEASKISESGKFYSQYRDTKKLLDLIT